VFTLDGELYRQVNAVYRPHYDRLVESGLLTDLVERGWLVRHEEVRGTELLSSGAYKVLRPERVPFVSYPYEWSFSQLRDAARLTLRIQQRALKAGMSLKDASAYNVQYLKGKPVFIDTLSFETRIEGRPWVAYRQFCQHFLSPLALMAHRDVRLGQLSRVFLDGVPLDLASELLPRRTRLKSSLAIHLHLHAWAQRRYAHRPGPAPARRRTLSETGLVGLVGSLRSAIESLRWIPRSTEWSEYYDETNYSEAALAEKEQRIATIIERLRPATVWDLGSNTGRFSRVASRNGITTMAFDADPSAVDKNYLAAVASGDSHLLPLLMDLTNPSANLGWANAERLSLEQRGPADLALALAFVHHLAIGNNLPFAMIAAWFARMARHLVIEFVPKTDSQVQRMLSSRDDIFDEYTQPAFEEAFGRLFMIEATEPILDTRRLLYVMRRR
jgi:hypothetical protein